MTLIQAVALARGTREDANARRVAVFRTIGGQRQAAAFDLTAIRRGQAPDPQDLPRRHRRGGRIAIKAMQKQVLQSIAVAFDLQAFLNGGRANLGTRRTIVNNSLAVPNQGPWPRRPICAGQPQLGPGQRTYSATNILDFPTLMRIIHHWRWLVLGAIALGLAGAILATLLTKPVYRAWVTLEANPPTVSVSDEQSREREATAMNPLRFRRHPGRPAGEQELLRERTAQELNLANNPDVVAQDVDASSACRIGDRRWFGAG